MEMKNLMILSIGDSPLQWKEYHCHLDWAATLSKGGFFGMNEFDFYILRPARFAHERNWILPQPAAFIFQSPAGHALRTRDRTLRLLYGARRVFSVDRARHLREPVVIESYRIGHATSW
jgi:hypothetical protein